MLPLDWPEESPWDTFFINDGCGRAETIVDGATSGQVVLGDIRKQAQTPEISQTLRYQLGSVQDLAAAPDT